MTRKMIGVIYRAFKEGKLPSVTKESINDLYTYVDKIQNYDFEKRNHADIVVTNTTLKECVEECFNGNYDRVDMLLKGFSISEWI